jgi:hypothetical protein
MKNKNSFTKSDLWASVVFAGFDGGSYSAIIVEVNLQNPPSVRVVYFPTGPQQPVFATLIKADWARLTRFGADKFLAPEVL